MASLTECELALRAVIDRVHAVDPEVRRKYAVTRTIALRVPDLQVVFLASLDEDSVQGLRMIGGQDTEGAQIRLSADSDDVLALVDGTVAPAVAWATGRVRIEASMLDLLKLRSLL